ncbi:hypothetical protein [Streptomyces sp. AK02-01A]|nr:hypothetical protein [Streptomyces sp. AK02-01A]MDX3849434.1 hypothetical protein [Streptomyces sp. AK02-01A]
MRTTATRSGSGGLTGPDIIQIATEAAQSAAVVGGSRLRGRASGAQGN